MTSSFRLPGRVLVIVAIFIACLLIFEYIFLPPKMAAIIIANHIETGNYLRLLAVAALSFVSIAIAFGFYAAALSSRAAGRILYFLIFAFVTFAEYSHHRAFGQFSSFHNAAVGLFVGDRKFIFDAVRMYAEPLALIPIGVFGALLVLTRRTAETGLRFFVLLILLTVGYFAATAYFTRNSYYTISTSAAARTLVGFPVIWYAGTVNGMPRSVAYAIPREPLNFHSETTPANNVVFIVDESVRGDHLSINGYHTPTTPFLDALVQKGVVKNWGVAAAGSTCSAQSNNLLLTGLIDLPDPKLELLKMPTIFQYAKAMNYKTHYIDASVNAMWLGKTSDRRDMDERIGSDELMMNVAKKYDVDGEAARRIAAIVSTSTGNFVWLNKNGVHKPYSDNYPNGERRDEGGIYYSADVGRDALVRDYENALRYNLDLFFSELFNEGVPANTIFIYTSDHGQTLMENGAVVSHCSTTQPEANVPLLMIANDTKTRAADTTYKASHANIFPTILDLLGVPASERKYHYAVSLLDAHGADSAPRYYFAGDLHGGDGASYPFDQ